MEATVDSVIRTRGLAKSYRGRAALQGIDLDVPRNVVFGYLGPNGAGKTTTIRLLAGLLRPTAGTAEILGSDSVRDRERAQRHIGYLPGEFVAYPDLTGAQYLRFIGNLRGGMDWSVAEDIAKRLDLDLTARVGTLSHGNKQKVGIVQAFMHQPEVLILDEPTTGLDPLAQREFLGLIREARDQGHTVFLSSHILYEVEAVADMVGILRRGRLIVVETVDRLKARALRRIDLTFEGQPPLAALRAVPSVREASASGTTANLVVEGSTADLLEVAAPHRVAQVVTHEPDLEEIFMSYYGQGG
ncbi:MAG TPA: ABC transporter ATP-binding protein [Micromonosporaceae bacterium]|nr:ABC transporter ATP-binding protein [Micromonosporaceae bacterium]